MSLSMGSEAGGRAKSTNDGRDLSMHQLCCMSGPPAMKNRRQTVSRRQKRTPFRNGPQRCIPRLKHRSRNQICHALNVIGRDVTHHFFRLPKRDRHGWNRVHSEAARSNSVKRAELPDRCNHCDHCVGCRTQRCWASFWSKSGGKGPASLAAMLASTFLMDRIPGMTVPTVGSERENRSAISAMVIPAGITGRSASARSTLAFRFSGTK